MSQTTWTANCSSHHIYSLCVTPLVWRRSTLKFVTGEALYPVLHVEYVQNIEYNGRDIEDIAEEHICKQRMTLPLRVPRDYIDPMEDLYSGLREQALTAVILGDVGVRPQVAIPTIAFEARVCLNYL